jgi:multicomponent K+:H+ antiporter subunit E
VKRLLPQPWMSASLFAGWLLLNNSIAAGTIVGGAVLAIALPLFTQRFWPEYPQTVRLLPLLRLTAVFLYDVVIANLRVAMLILGPAGRVKPHFVVVPIDLKQPFSVTLLASVISLTPGTISANLSGDRSTLLIHDLNVEDPNDTVQRIKSRYERPLKEIFE